ncbi:MAG: hypothetical protein ACOX8V_05270 [Thermoleophilia bacterium]|jgi:hypothetical protein
MAESEHPKTQEEEAELLARFQDEIRRMSVADHLLYMLESLAALAARKLGLAPDAHDERDPEQAKLAIDAFRAVLQVVEPTRPQQEVTAHRGVLSQLQLAYVKVLDAPEEDIDSDAAGAPEEDVDADAVNDEAEAESVAEE